MDWLWMWVAVLLLALTLEIVTEQLISVWLIPAAAVAALIDVLNASIIWQSLVFVAVAAVGIAVARPYALRLKRGETDHRELDSVVGEKCTVTERIDTFAGCGQAKVNGQLWSARGLEPDDIFEEGAVLRIVGVEGVKLICKRI